MSVVSSRLLVWRVQPKGTAPLAGSWVCRENVLFEVVVTLGVTSWWPPELRSPEDLKTPYMPLEFDGTGSSGEDT